MARQDRYYYDGFVKLMELALEEAQLLLKELHSFESSRIEILKNRLGVLEHDGDTLQQEVLKRLGTAFITPLEREDIMELVYVLGAVGDGIEEVVLRMYMYDINKLRPQTLKFGEIIVNQCQQSLIALREFQHSKHSGKFFDSMREVADLEREADRYYAEVMRELYRFTKDPIELLVWTRIFDQFERCCDAIKDSILVLERVAMKNS